MNRSEHIHKIKNQLDKIAILIEQLMTERKVLNSLKQNFAAEHCEFQPGTKVRLRTPAHKCFNPITQKHVPVPEKIRYAFVEDNYVDEDSLTIEPILTVCKKDGTKGVRREYRYRAIIEKV